MIYDVLKSYRRYLEEKYQSETARTYYIRLCSLFKGQSLVDIERVLNINNILKNLADIKYKNYFSQSKNAFLNYCEFQNIQLPTQVLEIIKELELNTHRKYRRLELLDYTKIESKINHLHNEKMKLCYRVLVSTGLRVSELAGITADNCLITPSNITFHFVGKGGQNETVSLYNHEYPALYENIKEHIENTAPDQKLFYSAIYLQTTAKKLGFKCHDLRRVFAKTTYKKSRSKTLVMEKLRHTNIKTTEIYLKSRIKI